MKKILITCLTLVCALTIVFGFGTMKKVNADEKFLKEVSVTLTDGIDVNYYVSGATDYDTAVMDFSYCNGKTKRITESLTDGSATITFKGIAPQYMTEKVVATLTLKAGETEGATETKEFSLQNYVKSVLALEKTSKQTDVEYEAMRALAVDLLYYGDEAMRYVAAETIGGADLATAVLTDEQKALKTTATAIDESEYVAPADNTGANFRWVSYGARFDNKFGVYFEFIAKSVENLKIKFSSGAEITEFETRTQTVGKSQITVYKAVNELFAVDYANVLTARAYSGETKIGSAITYSVKSLTVDFGSDTKEYALALSACAYGEAAANYKKTTIKCAHACEICGKCEDKFAEGENCAEKCECVKADATLAKSNKVIIDAESVRDYDIETRSDIANAHNLKAGQMFVEDVSGASGGKVVGCMLVGSTMNFRFILTEDAKVSIQSVLSGSFTTSIDTLYTFELDGKAVTPTAGTFTSSGMKDLQTVSVCIADLMEGMHTLKMVVKTNIDQKLDGVAFTVLDKDLEAGLNTIEAENLGTSTWVHQAGVADFTEEWNNDFGSGVCAKGLGAGTVMNVSVNVKKRSLVKLGVRMSHYNSTTYSFASDAFKFNGTTLTPTPAGDFGHREADDYWKWVDVSLGELMVSAGTYTLQAKLYFVNVDYFTFDVTEIDGTLAETGTSVIEMENLTDMDIKTRPDFVKAGRAEDGKFALDVTDTASNGKAISGFQDGTVFNVNFLVTEAGIYKISLVGANDADYPVPSMMAFMLDGKEITVSSGNLKGTTHGEIPAYWDWQTIEISSSALTVGAHKLTIKIISGHPNLDCVKIEAVAASTAE